jgi:UDP-2,3-diacylglucosamine pyrophosphatase LpxH
VRTAIVSDLHLGAVSDEDILRDAGIRAVLFEALAGADHLVLLGDVVELRDFPLGPALERARPFFEELGAALPAARITLVPGNHDHRLAEPLLDELSMGDAGPLSLEHRQPPSNGPLAALARWLAPAQLEVAYPGTWIREDVYATHGHYMDAHLRLPRAECLAVATMVRASGPLPDPAAPADYERVTRPVYGFGFGVAQVRRHPLTRGQNRPSEAAWKLLSGAAEEDGGGRRLTARAVRTGFPAVIWGLNRLLRSDFQSDVTAQAIFRGGVEAASEVARRLRLEGVHVITGHSHRAGPLPEEGDWELPGGGRLHNTGSWCFATAFHHPGRPPNDYWPGTLTWVEDEAPPRREELLRDRSHAEMTALVGGA